VANAVGINRIFERVRNVLLTDQIDEGLGAIPSCNDNILLVFSRFHEKAVVNDDSKNKPTAVGERSSHKSTPFRAAPVKA